MKSRARAVGKKKVKEAEKQLVCDGVIGGKMWKIFNISLFSSQSDQVLKILEEKLDSGTKKYWVATVNPEFVMTAEKDNRFKQILTKTDLNVMDGIGLVWAKELACRPVSLSAYQIVRFFEKLSSGVKVGVEVLKGKYRDQVSSGADLVLDLAKIAAEKNKKIFLLGGWGDRAEKTAIFLKKKYNLRDNQLDWCGGEPAVPNAEALVKINKFKPDILLVAYGMKTQEFWIEENLNKIEVGMVMGVGRSFDYYSGELKRAPEKWRKIGMEWLYSLIKQPGRLKRQLVLPGFVWKVLKKV